MENRSEFKEENIEFSMDFSWGGGIQYLRGDPKV